MGRNGTSPDSAGLPGTVSDRCNDTMLSVVDFGQISSIAGYLQNTTQVNLVLGEYLPGWHVVYSQVYNVSNTGRTSFIHIARGATSIIAVRGTSSVVEVLEDLNFWMPVGFLQLASSFGPSFYSTRSILQTLTSGERTSYRKSAFFDLVEYVGSVKNDTLGHTLYITGHSLGGGIAAAIGGIYDIPAVTFSAPGLKATSTILRPEPKADPLVRQIVNVVPDRDLVPKVDEQAGTVLRTVCPLGNPGNCHRLSVTMCELLASCGDGGGRDIPRGYKRSCDVCVEAGQELHDFCG